MTVVPGIVIDQNSSVRETSNLVTIIPPGHNLSIFLGVSSHPVVGLSEVINDELVSSSVSAS